MNRKNFLLLALLAGLTGCAHDRVSPPAHPVAATETMPPALASPKPVAPATMTAEQMRSACIAGRRLICGRVLKVAPGGIVVESGYTDLLRPPLTESWVIPSTVSVSRNHTTIELNQPGTPCIGDVFLTDLPRRPKVRQFDYIVLMGYPAGSYVYTSVPGVSKSIRRFAAGLESAVKLNLQARENTASAQSVH